MCLTDKTLVKLYVSRSLPETKDPIVYISLKMDLIVSNLFLAQPNSKLPGIRVFILCATIMTIVETQQIPQHLLKDLASMNDITQVLRRYGVPSNREPFPQMQSMQVCVGSFEKCRDRNRMASVPNQGMQPEVSYLQAQPAKSDVELAVNAGCAPTETVIEMPKTDSSIVVYPPGTKVKRCSGICGHSNLLCRPTKTGTLIRKGLILKYDNGNLVPVEYQNFSLEEHLACSCDCLEKPIDCLSLIHTYNGNNCKCMCKDPSKAELCGPHRIWDERECRCKCPSHCGTRSCPIGMIFDDEYHCSCINISMASRSGRRRPL